MKHKYVSVLGRPGCGKSALYRELKERILGSGQAATVERVDDFPKLWAKLQEDDALEREGKERIYSSCTGDRDYRITDDSLLDLMLKELNSDLLEIDKPGHMVIVEFSRPNYVGALQVFDRRILGDCIAIYMEVSFDTCWARNVARHEAATTAGGDDHLVPRAEMEKRFLNDDQDAFIQHMVDQNIPVLVVNNETDGKEHLKRQVDGLYAELFQAYPSALGQSQSTPQT